MELQLISASVVAGEPADCAVVYHLEEVKNLPVISQAHPWAGRNICALRDRSVALALTSLCSISSLFLSRLFISGPQTYDSLAVLLP